MRRPFSFDPLFGAPRASAHICHCMAVNEAAIAEAWDAGARDVDTIIAVTRACTGCGTCRPRVRALLRRLKVRGWLGR